MVLSVFIEKKIVEVGSKTTNFV